MTDDLSTVAGFEKLIENIKATAADRMRTRGDVPAMAYFVATRDERTGRPLSPPGLLTTFIDDNVINDHGSRGAKPKMALFLARMARRSQAIGYVFVSEAWVAPPDMDIRPDGSWENLPGRREALQVIYQHNALGPDAHQWSCEVRRHRKGRPKLSPWRGGEDAKADGRFVRGILPDAEEQAAREEAMSMLSGSGAHLTPEERRKGIQAARDRLIAEGHPADLIDKTMRVLIAEMEERGTPVAQTLDEMATAPARNDAPGLVSLDIIDLSKEPP